VFAGGVGGEREARAEPDVQLRDVQLQRTVRLQGFPSIAAPIARKVKIFAFKRNPCNWKLSSDLFKSGVLQKPYSLIESFV